MAKSFYVSFYPQRVNDRFLAPACAGDADNANAAGTSASFVCGAFTKVTLRIDSVSKSIVEAKFHTNGCGYMVAAADVVCEWLEVKEFQDLDGLADSSLMQIIGREIGSFPIAREQCAGVVFEAIHRAMAAYRKDRIEEFRGETALVCTCFGVSEETIVDAISANQLNDVIEVAENCRAGSGCGSCRMLIQELLDAREVVGTGRHCDR
ncbi:MAG TPA: iron-sulfur cluster assembly scaffold protein [Pyrinomonadaceae bacterium]